MRDLGTLGGATSGARYVNDARQVVGSSTTADGNTHAFLWTIAGGIAWTPTVAGGYNVAVEGRRSTVSAVEVQTALGYVIIPSGP